MSKKRKKNIMVDSVDPGDTQCLQSEPKKMLSAAAMTGALRVRSLLSESGESWVLRHRGKPVAAQCKFVWI